MDNKAFYQQIVENTDFTEFFKELGMENAEEAVKTEFIENSLDSIGKRMMVEMNEMISDEDLEAFAALEDPNEGFEYLKGKGIDMAEIASKVIVEFRTGLVESMAYARGVIDASQGNTEAGEEE